MTDVILEEKKDSGLTEIKAPIYDTVTFTEDLIPRIVFNYCPICGNKNEL